MRRQLKDTIRSGVVRQTTLVEGCLTDAWTDERIECLRLECEVFGMAKQGPKIGSLATGSAAGNCGNQSDRKETLWRQDRWTRAEITRRWESSRLAANSNEA
jgi:hypothetical protein